MTWWLWVLFIVLFALFWFWMGILYKGRKFRPILSTIKDHNLSSSEKERKLINLIT